MDPEAIHLMMSQLQHLLDGSKGEVGVASKSPMGLNNEEKHFFFSLQNPSNHIAPGHQLENITSGADMVTGTLPYDSSMFTHQAFLDANPPPPLAPPTSVPSMAEAIPQLLAAVPLPSDPSQPHLPPSPPSLGPDELMPCDPSAPLPAFLGQMMPPQLMPTYLPPPFHMWIPRPMMMHSMPQMMPMMGGAMPYLPLGPTSAATPTTAVLGDQEVLGSRMEGEERGEGGEEGAGEDEREGEEGAMADEGGGEEERKEAEWDPAQQPSSLEAATMATSLHLTDTESQHSAPSEDNPKEENPAEVPPPSSVTTPTGPLPSLPRRPAVSTSCHDSTPQPPADYNKEESDSHDNSQGLPRPFYDPSTRQGQRSGWKPGNFKPSSRWHGNHGNDNNYRHSSKQYYARRGPPDMHQMPYEVARGGADKTLPGERSSPPSCSPFQSSWSGDPSPSHHQYSNCGYSYPRQRPGVADQSFDSSRSQMTSRPREWRQNWHDYDSVIANQQRMLDRYPKKYPERCPERYPERNPERYPERNPERNPERYPERNPERYPEES